MPGTQGTGGIGWARIWAFSGVMRHSGGRLIREPKAHTHGVLRKSRMASRKILALDPHDQVAGQTDVSMEPAEIW
jgi:hypothetical protein